MVLERFAVAITWALTQVLARSKATFTKKVYSSNGSLLSSTLFLVPAWSLFAALLCSLPKRNPLMRSLVRRASSLKRFSLPGKLMLKFRDAFQTLRKSLKLLNWRNQTLTTVTSERAFARELWSNVLNNYGNFSRESGPYKLQKPCPAWSIVGNQLTLTKYDIFIQCPSPWGLYDTFLRSPENSGCSAL